MVWITSESCSIMLNSFLFFDSTNFNFVAFSRILDYSPSFPFHHDFGSPKEDDHLCSH